MCVVLYKIKNKNSCSILYHLKLIKIKYTLHGSKSKFYEVWGPFLRYFYNLKDIKDWDDQPQKLHCWFSMVFCICDRMMTLGVALLFLSFYLLILFLCLIFLSSLFFLLDMVYCILFVYLFNGFLTILSLFVTTRGCQGVG